jgi:hypothetical protein
MLATSNWYFIPSDHRCPHDAWLGSLDMHEPASGKRSEIRNLSLTMRLLGAYQDGFIELRYPQVFSYRMDVDHSEQGHRDWRYDELRVSDDGHLLHEIEWCGTEETGHWLIEASDVLYRWIAK